jgi:23S rRNA (cytosine1962-C5)-methyltransferase
MSMTLPQVILKPNEDRRLRRGHLWVFSNEVAVAPADLTPGDAVQFITHRKDLLGTGFYNPHSLIAGRLMDRGDVALDADFFERRFRTALELRKRFFNEDAYRWVFGESDDLPGLVVDRYDNAVVIESYCAGMDRLLPAITEGLKRIQPWDAIVLRNDVGPRRLERLEEKVEVMEGQVNTPHSFVHEGLKLFADLVAGQKTGFFFDQRHNRRTVAELAKGSRVLDVFCHTGGFGLMAAKAGAAQVVGIDESAPALALAGEAARANGFEARTHYEKADAFQFLSSGQETFDIVVVDPPKFASGKKQLPQAEEAYIRLNALAMRRVKGGGFLATASCSQHVERDTFRQIISRASLQSGRRARVVHWGSPAPDHPVRLSMPETDYLKFALVHVI